MSFVFFTSIEIIFALIILIEVKNKNKLIDFESRIIKAIRFRIKKKIMRNNMLNVYKSTDQNTFRKSA